MSPEVRGSSKTGRAEELVASLISQGFLSESDARRAYEGAEAAQIPLADAITGLGIIAPTDLANAVCTVSSLRRFDGRRYSIRADTGVLSDVFGAAYGVAELAPEYGGGQRHLVGIADPFCDATMDALEFSFDGQVDYVVFTADELKALLSTAGVGHDDDEDPESPSAILLSDVDRLRELASDTPVVTYLDSVLDQATRLGASDIHFEPDETGLRVRLRIDGMLSAYPSPPDHDALAVVSRLKILAGLDIAERRLPQDGRMQFVVSGRDVDCRVATGPTTTGESVVLRLLDKRNHSSDFARLGFDPDTTARLEDALSVADGIVLVTGPTGSGKSTTLYAALNHLNNAARKILTVEDPVEFSIAGVNQVQVDAKAGRDFPKVLRSFLRQDPDVMMVGEIRDAETAGIAMQAALTGHLVLSTLHTNSAIEAIVRLRDLGVPDYLIAATVRLIVAQRLVRRLCDGCKQTGPVARVPSAARDGGEPRECCIRGSCAECNHTGFRGRTVVFEALQVTREVRDAISAGASSEAIAEMVRKHGFQTLADSGRRLVELGETTLDEVYRVTRRDDE